MIRTPKLKDIKHAAQAIKGIAIQTPLLNVPLADAEIGCRILLKAENLQPTGAFKIRGAFNALHNARSRKEFSSVVSWSSGNHAQAVALSAKIAGMNAKIIMPDDAPEVKKQNTRALGGEIVLTKRSQNREAIALEYAQKTGALMIPPYDDFSVVAGNGTIGVESIEQCRTLGHSPDAIFVPCGGGGMLSGIAIACQNLSPQTILYCCEPKNYDSMGRGLRNEPPLENARTDICDALMAPRPGRINLAICRSYAVRARTVEERHILEAISFAFQRFRIVLEPGGAIGLAQLLRDQEEFKGKTVLIIASGGNIDPDIFLKALNSRTYT